MTEHRRACPCTEADRPRAVCRCDDLAGAGWDDDPGSRARNTIAAVGAAVDRLERAAAGEQRAVPLARAAGAIAYDALSLRLAGPELAESAGDARVLDAVAAAADRADATADTIRERVDWAAVAVVDVLDVLARRGSVSSRAGRFPLLQAGFGDDVPAMVRARRLATQAGGYPLPEDVAGAVHRHVADGLGLDEAVPAAVDELVDREGTSWAQRIERRGMIAETAALLAGLAVGHAAWLAERGPYGCVVADPGAVHWVDRAGWLDAFARHSPLVLDDGRILLRLRGGSAFPTVCAGSTPDAVVDFGPVGAVAVEDLAACATLAGQIAARVDTESPARAWTLAARLVTERAARGPAGPVLAGTGA